MLASKEESYHPEVERSILEYSAFFFLNSLRSWPVLCINLCYVMRTFHLQCLLVRCDQEHGLWGLTRFGFNFCLQGTFGHCELGNPSQPQFLLQKMRLKQVSVCQSLNPLVKRLAKRWEILILCHWGCGKNRYIYIYLEYI